jgi:hypothetical protein
MRPEQTWSLLDEKPVLLYLPNIDEYIVYWNGIAMTHSIALNMSMEYMGIFVTPEMRKAMQDNYCKIYYANGFGTRAWDGIVSRDSTGIYSYLRRACKEHLNKVCKDADPKEILSWFNYKRARTLEK